MSEKQTSTQQLEAGGYRITAAARHAANVVARNYSFQPQPGQKIEPTADNVARIIDYSTRLPQMLPLLKDFCVTHPWYEPKHQRRNGHGYIDSFVDWLGEGQEQFSRSDHLEDDLERLRYSIRQIQIEYEKIPKLAQRGVPCGAAWNATKNLLKLYSFQQRWRLVFSARNLALLIDTSAVCFRIQASVERLLQDSGWQDPSQLRRNIERTREAIRVIELVKNSAPAYGPETQYSVKVTDQPKRIDRSKVTTERELSDLRSQMANATSPGREQKILGDWRIQHGNS